MQTRILSMEHGPWTLCEPGDPQDVPGLLCTRRFVFFSMEHIPSHGDHLSLGTTRRTVDHGKRQAGEDRHQQSPTIAPATC